MKKTLIILLLFVPYICNCQIPKNANTIIITDTLNKAKLYSMATEILFNNGYGILNSDKEMGTITTTDKPFSKGKIRLLLLVKDNKIVIHGDYDPGITIDLGGVSTTFNWMRIENYGMKRSPNIAAWNEMQKVSDAIPGQKSYLIN